MNLNGWQRAWIVLVVIWLPLGLWQYAAIFSEEGLSLRAVVAGLAVYAIPLAVLYAFGTVIAWVRRGFLQPISK